MHRIDRSFRTVLVAAALATSCLAHAADVAVEHFAYGGTPNLAGANGGTGWGGPWFKLSSIPTGNTPDGMTWSGLASSGGSAFTAAYPSSDYTRYSRAIAPYASSGDVVYISFLFRPNAGFGVGGGLAFGTWENGMIVGLVPGTGRYGLSGFQGPGMVSDVVAAVGTAVFLVARVEKNSDGTITWSLHVDPIVGAPEPATHDATMTIPGSALPQAVVLYNDGGYSTDEIRVATTWNEALGLPPACPADLDGDGVVAGSDLAALLGQWGGAGTADLTGDGLVDADDLAVLLGAWGSCG
jgi:hypothetical protein